MWFDSYLTTESDTNLTIEKFKKCVQFLNCLNAEVVIINEDTKSIFRKDFPIFDKNVKPIFNEETFKSVIQGLNKLYKIASDVGIRFVYHPHMGTGIQNFDEISYLMDNTDSSKISLLLDTGHLYLASIDPLKVIKKYGKRIKHVHLKDVREKVFLEAKKQNLSFLECVKLGIFNVPSPSNLIDFPVILKSLQRLGYNHWFVVEAEQDPNKYSPVLYGKIAKKYLEQLL